MQDDSSSGRTSDGDLSGRVAALESYARKVSDYLLEQQALFRALGGPKESGGGISPVPVPPHPLL